MGNKVSMKTPQLLVVGKTFLHKPDFKTADRFPRMSEDGNRNLNLKYKLKVGLDTTNIEQQAFITWIQFQEKALIQENVIMHSILKPKMEKGEDDKFHPNDKILTIELTSLDMISVFEGTDQIGGDKLQLDSKTNVVVEFTVVTYAFENKEGHNVSGLKLYPQRINVLSRPTRISIPKR